MRIWKKTLPIMVLMLSLLACSNAFSADYDIHNKAQLEAFVDGSLIPLMEKAHSQSAVVMIKKDGELLLSKGYGYQNIEQGITIDPNTSMFRPGSISKLYTWLAVMQLVEQGKLDLDTDVNQYLNTFKIKDTFPGQPVTMRHIMTHTAGFEEGWAGYLIVTDQDKLMPLAEAMAKYQPARVYAPGERVAYSNWATATAGLIVANVSGENFETYIENHFLEPLGMTHATFREPLPDQLAEFEAKPYIYSGGRYVADDFEFISNFGPAGSSSISAADMMKFGQMILNGGSYQGQQLLKPETIQYMLDNGYVKDPRLNGMALGFMEWSYGYKGMQLFGHGGATTKFFSHLGISKPEDLVIFVSVSHDYEILDAFLNNFYGAYFSEPLVELTPSADFAAQADKYTGTYVSSRDNFTGIESVLRIVSNVRVTLMPDNTLSIDGERYVQQDGNLFRHLYKNKWLAFVEDEHGKITGFAYDGWGFSELYRAKWWETSTYNFMLLALCLIISLLVLIRSPLQWKHYAACGHAAKRAYATTLVLSICNLLFLLLVALIFSVSNTLMYEIPVTLTIALCASTITLPVALFHLYTSIQSWLGHGIPGTWSKIKHTVITLVGLLMVSFYYTWNFIGFHYFS
jgi:CubicO group peptidase (beta-lactamase class C family)